MNNNSAEVPMERIYIKTPYITLGQLLKFSGIIQNGGETKFYLMENEITVNGVIDNRRGKKCYPGDKIIINQKIELQVERSQDA